MPAPLPRVNVSAQDEMSMCARSVYMSVCVGGLQEGAGAAQIQEEDIQSAFRLSLEGGPSLSCANIPGALTLS